MSKEKIFIVTPIANEATTISEQLDKISSLGIEGLEAVYVIDNYSKDATRSIIEAYAQRHPWVHLHFFAVSRGVVSCYLEGMKYALERGADIVVEMDAGLSHDPSMIPVFIAKLREGYDCVFGSRFIKGGGFEGLPWHRYALSRYGTFLSNIVLGTRLSDMTSGFEAFHRRVLEQISLDDFLSVTTTHFYQTEMRYYCHRLKWAELPIVFRGSSTGLSLKSVVKSLQVLGALKGRRPLAPFANKA